MKKIIGIIVLCFLTCNVSFADNLKIVDGAVSYTHLTLPTTPYV